MHKFLPMPDNYSRIYTETCGTPVKTQHGAEKVLCGIADHLAKTSKPVLAKAASKKATSAKGRDECLKEEIKKIPAWAAGRRNCPIVTRTDTRVNRPNYLPFYNHSRMHSSLNYESPAKYEIQFA